METTNNNNELLTTEQLVSIFSVCKATIYSFVKRRGLKSHKIGKRIYYRRNDVEAFIQAGKQAC